jgi:hypothetical protein
VRCKVPYASVQGLIDAMQRRPLVGLAWMATWDKREETAVAVKYRSQNKKRVWALQSIICVRPWAYVCYSIQAIDDLCIELGRFERNRGSRGL